MRFLKRWKYTLITVVLLALAITWLSTHSFHATHSRWWWLAFAYPVLLLLRAGGNWLWNMPLRRTPPGPLSPASQRVVDHWLAQGWEPERCRCRRRYPHAHLRNGSNHLVAGGGA